MRGLITHAFLALVAAAGTALVTVGLAAAGTASAATAAARYPVIHTTSQAGYVTSGRWFRFVSTTVTVAPHRSTFNYAEVVLGGTRVPPVTLAVKAGGGPTSVGWSVGAPPFHMAGGVMPKVAPKPGDVLRMDIYYDQHGHVYVTASDITRRVSKTVRIPVSTRTVYTAAEAAGVVDNSTVVPPQVSTRLWAFTSTHVTTYTGVRGSLLGPWRTSQVIDTTTGTPSGRVVISAPVLWNHGHNFGVWLRPSA